MVRRRLILLTPVITAAMLALPSAARANWGGVSNCGWKEEPVLEHCYATTVWLPNVHKNIREVWTYVTAEDVRFGKIPNPTQEFTTMETWVSWAVPGTKVEEPITNVKWVEGGLSYQPNDFPEEDHAGECHP